MREIFESHHARGYIRLFPVNNEKSMDLLSKCFEILLANKSDMSWKSKYIQRTMNEKELLNEIARLEEKTPKDILRSDRAMSSMEFTFESSEGESRSGTDRLRKPSVKITDSSPIRQAATQTPADISRSVSLSSTNTPKRTDKSPISTGTVTRARAESLKASSGVSAARITEKRAYDTEHREHHRSQSARTHESNDKSQLVKLRHCIHEHTIGAKHSLKIPIGVISYILSNVHPTMRFHSDIRSKNPS